MPRKIRSKSQAASRKYSRSEIILFAVMVVVALSMVFGTIATAVSR